MSGPTYDNRKARFAGGPKTASKKLSHVKRAAASRKVLPGYPRTTMFADPQEVFDYLNADHIICLRCGKPYKALNTHLRVHGWTHDQYRIFYGLPWTKGLSSAGTKKIQKANANRRVEEGTMVNSGITPEVRAKAQQTPSRKRAPYLNVLSIQNLANKKRVE